MLTEATKAQAVRLLAPVGGNEHVLHYRNYSLVMHSQRRFAIYTAANVSFGGRYDLSRSTDVWRVDPRIPLDCRRDSGRSPGRRSVCKAGPSRIDHREVKGQHQC